MGTKVIDIAALVRKYEPDRLSKKRVEYVFGSGQVVKKRRQARPGETYPWALT